MSENKEDTLRQFCDVTGADENRSKFFLESSNWQLEVALSSFYEHGGNIDEAPSAPTVASMPPLSDSDMDSPTRSPAQPQKKDRKKPSNSNFATLDSLHQESSSDEEEVSKFGWKIKSEDIIQEFFCYPPTCSKKKEKCSKNSQNKRELCNALEEIEVLKKEIDRLTLENLFLKEEIARLKDTDESGEAFYAGGSERSGQQILGPGKGRKDIVLEMFKSVRQLGAVVLEDEPSSSRGRGGVFSGVGYRLGQTTDDHEQVTPGNTKQQDNQARLVRLKLFREGFSVDEGPLRHYTNPENAEFLNCILRGEIPAELSKEGREVRLSLEDRRHEECPRVSVKHQVFSGKGHLLGSPTPATVGATVPVAATCDDRTANQRAAQEAVRLDENSPVTTVQFRLADGSRLTGRFNHSHTVGDLQQFVSRAEPAYQLQPFALLTSYPSAELADSSATLQQANLLNTTLLQRLK